MRIRLRCTDSDCGHPIDITAGRADPTTAACPACGREHSLRIGEVLKQNVLAHCPHCSGEELYVRKDFPQRVGVMIVVVAALVSCILYAGRHLVAAMAVLAAVVLIDLVIYGLVPRVTVCYRCRTEFRDVPVNPRHRGFDLATAEKYAEGT